MNRGTLLAGEHEVQVAKRKREEELLTVENGLEELEEEQESDTVTSDEEPSYHAEAYEDIDIHR
jgi:hypothetical protein